MRSVLAGGGLLVALAASLLAAAALAAGGQQRPYSGTDRDSLCGSDPALPCTVTFTGVVRHGKVKKVTKFDFQGVPLSCDEGLVAEDPAHPQPSMHVKANRRFSESHTNPRTGVHVRVAGRFSRSFRKARGTFRVHGPTFGTTSGTFHNCDTGVDHYSVQKVTG